MNSKNKATTSKQQANRDSQKQPKAGKTIWGAERKYSIRYLKYLVDFTHILLTFNTKVHLKYVDCDMNM